MKVTKRNRKVAVHRREGVQYKESAMDRVLTMPSLRVLLAVVLVVSMIPIAGFTASAYANAEQEKAEQAEQAAQAAQTAQTELAAQVEQAAQTQQAASAEQAALAGQETQAAQTANEAAAPAAAEPVATTQTSTPSTANQEFSLMGGDGKEPEEENPQITSVSIVGTQEGEDTLWRSNEEGYRNAQLDIIFDKDVTNGSVTIKLTDENDTNSFSGTQEISATAGTAASLTVDLSTLKKDDSGIFDEGYNGKYKVTVTYVVSSKSAEGKYIGIDTVDPTITASWVEASATTIDGAGIQLQYGKDKTSDGNTQVVSGITPSDTGGSGIASGAAVALEGYSGSALSLTSNDALQLTADGTVALAGVKLTISDKAGNKGELALSSESMKYGPDEAAKIVTQLVRQVEPKSFTASLGATANTRDLSDGTQKVYFKGTNVTLFTLKAESDFAEAQIEYTLDESAAAVFACDSSGNVKFAGDIDADKTANLGNMKVTATVKVGGVEVSKKQVDLTSILEKDGKSVSAIDAYTTSEWNPTLTYTYNVDSSCVKEVEDSGNYILYYNKEVTELPNANLLITISGSDRDVQGYTLDSSEDLSVSSDGKITFKNEAEITAETLKAIKVRATDMTGQESKNDNNLTATYAEGSKAISKVIRDVTAPVIGDIEFVSGLSGSEGYIIGENGKRHRIYSYDVSATWITVTIENDLSGIEKVELFDVNGKAKTKAAGTKWGTSEGKYCIIIGIDESVYEPNGMWYVVATDKAGNEATKIVSDDSNESQSIANRDTAGPTIESSGFLAGDGKTAVEETYTVLGEEQPCAYGTLTVGDDLIALQYAYAKSSGTETDWDPVVAKIEATGYGEVASSGVINYNASSESVTTSLRFSDVIDYDSETDEYEGKFPLGLVVNQKQYVKVHYSVTFAMKDLANKDAVSVTKEIDVYSEQGREADVQVSNDPDIEHDGVLYVGENQKGTIKFTVKHVDLKTVASGEESDAVIAEVISGEKKYVLSLEDLLTPGKNTVYTIVNPDGNEATVSIDLTARDSGGTRYLDDTDACKCKWNVYKNRIIKLLGVATEDEGTPVAKDIVIDTIPPDVSALSGAQGVEYNGSCYLYNQANTSTYTVYVKDANLKALCEEITDEEEPTVQDEDVVVLEKKTVGANFSPVKTYMLGELYAYAVKKDGAMKPEHVNDATFVEDEEGTKEDVLTVVFDLDDSTLKGDNGIYRVSTVTCGKLADLSTNVSTNKDDSLTYVVDTVAPTVSELQPAWGTDQHSNDGFYYLRTYDEKEKNDRTASITISDTNLVALCDASEAWYGQTAVVLETSSDGTTFNDVKSYSMRELYLAIGETDKSKLPAHVSSVAWNSEAKTAMDITFSLNDSFADGTYRIRTVTEGSLADLANNKSTSSNSKENYVIDNVVPTLTAAVYGAKDGNYVIDMVTSWLKSFFYGTQGGYFIKISAADNPANSTASGLHAVTLNKTAQPVTSTNIENGYVAYAARFPVSKDGVTVSKDEVTGDLWLEFKGDVAKEDFVVTDITFTASDNSGNTGLYKLDQKDGYLVVQQIESYQNGALLDENPTYLVKDTVAPTVTDLAQLSGYYNAPQTATVEVADANLEKLYRYAQDNGESDYNAQVLHVDAVDNGGANSPYDVSLSGFDMDGATLASDEPSASKTLTFAADADYTVTYTPNNIKDLSDNVCATQAQTASFTVDMINPTIDVSFDNNDVRNDKYYKAGRTATIVVTEHNFDASRISVETNGAVGSWSSSGDVHTLQVSYLTDGVYNLTVSGTDLAGNALETYTAPEFVVDLINPTVEISFPSASSSTLRAFNDTVTPAVTLADEANFDSNGATITLVGNQVGTVNYTTSTASSTNGQTITYNDFERVVGVDDIYTLTAKVTDLAGNESETKTETFSVNRFGSNFIIVDKAVYDGKYISEARDVVVQEVNVSGPDAESTESVENVSLTYGLKTQNLKHASVAGSSGVYTSSNTTQTNGWSVTTYTVPKRNFTDESGKAKDGQYQITVTSKDAAGNTNISSEYYDHDSNTAGASAVVEFVLDSEPPVVANLSVESGKTYDGASESTVTFDASDNVALKEVTATLDGQQVEVKNEGSGRYSLQVEPKNWTSRDLVVSVTDMANNTTTAEATGFHMSTDFLEIHLVPIVVGGIVVVGGVVAAVFIRRKKVAEAAAAAVNIASK